MNVRYTQTLALLTLTMLSAETLKAADWPNWRGPNYDGISTETDWDSSGMAIAWRSEVGVGFAGIAVADGRLYTMGHNGSRGDDAAETVYCLDAATGKPLWKHTYPCALLPRLHEGGPGATPTVHQGRVFTLSKEGQLHCLEADTGKVIWSHNVRDDTGRNVHEWGFSCSPLIVGDRVIVEAGQTVAYDKNTGKRLWMTKRFDPAYASITPFKHNDRQLIAVLNTNGIAIFDTADGRTLATAPWKTRFDTNATTPIVVGDRVFMSTGYSRGCALFRFTGSALEKVYENKNMNNHMATCVLLDGHLYGFNGNAHFKKTIELRCIDLATGSLKWAAAGYGCGAVLAAGDRLIVLSEKGELVVGPASPKGFEPTDRLQVFTGRRVRCWTVPVLSNGRIYCRNARGDLACVDVRKR